MLRRCIAWYDDVLYVRAVYYLVGLCNVIYLLLMFSVSLSQNHGHIIWIPGKNKNLPPPPNTLFYISLNRVFLVPGLLCVRCPLPSVCMTGPGLLCVRSPLPSVCMSCPWVTVCTVPTSQCVLRVRVVYCVVGRCTVC